jgi:Mg-chelatase subunit ChlD
LDLFEYVWLTSFQITKKSHEEVKILLRDDVKYPSLGKEKRGYVICVAKPKRRKDGRINYLGLLFDPTIDWHRRLLWQTFKASVFHLSMHIAASNYEAYAEWARDKNVDRATFVVSMLEDTVVRAGLKTLWAPFINDVAIADTLSYLKMKPTHLIVNPSLRFMASLLSTHTTGRVKGNVSAAMRTDLSNLVHALNEIQKVIHNEFSKISTFELDYNLAKGVTDLSLMQRLATADVMYEALMKYGDASETPSILYTENHGSDSIFFGNEVPSEQELEHQLQGALEALQVSSNGNGAQQLLKKSLNGEVSQVFSAWESKEAAEKKILQIYKALGSGSRFRSYEFPKEDFSEYIYAKAVVSSPIRRILDRLRLLKNLTGEDYRHEVGSLDMQEAIQVVASKSRRTDVFVRDELQSREDAWAILIDASRSLSSFKGEVRGITLCLSEVARNLFPNQNAWSAFAFNDKFYIVKEFSESYNNRTRARIGGLGQGGMTYLADALMLTAQALKKRTEESKLIVVVSDFFPSGNVGAEGALRACVKKIENSSIGVIGIGVQSRAVKNYFRINCVVSDPFELMKKFVNAFFEFSALA